MRILIADDDSVSRDLLQITLTDWGYDVVAASDGAEAWQILQSEDSPHLAILDWVMPGMDGIQLCKEIRKRRRGPYVYVMLLTARSGKTDVIEGLAAGADDYITRPFAPEELRVRLRAGTRVIDLQAELLAARLELQERATHDSLTRLPNRLLFADRLSQMLAIARRNKQTAAVMFLDLDRFKVINDTLGHHVGDSLLQGVANRLAGCLRDADTLARMGGDEFTIILGDVKSEQGATVVAQRALDALSQPFMLDGHELTASSSIGISFFPDHGFDVETLVKNADTAMYRAKENGRGRYEIYSAEVTMSVGASSELDRDLPKAIERDELTLHYQPRVDLSLRRILGVEALVRWQHPTLGILSPDQFIPMAEETGAIVAVTDWVLQTACAQNRAWQEAGYSPIDVAVNISPRHFQHGDLASSVCLALENSGLSPRYLSLEFPESVMGLNPASAVLQRLRQMGVLIAIDDFSMRRSSMSCLKRCPVDSVKIDRSFIKDVTANPDDAATAGAIVGMAHSLKLKVVAEGVETLEQIEFLRSLNCDEMQGYFISRPVPADQFTEQLAEEHSSWGYIDRPAA